jgi:hypothetical protein
MLLSAAVERWFPTRLVPQLPGRSRLPFWSTRRAPRSKPDRALARTELIPSVDWLALQPPSVFDF